MRKSPLMQLKDGFGTKDKLVAELVGRVEPLEGESKDDLKTRLSKVPNKKLLRLKEVEEKVEELFGSKEKLVAELLKLHRPGSKKVDQDYRNALVRKSKAELLSLHAAAARKAKARGTAKSPASKR
jgi:hypothetical protein